MSGLERDTRLIDLYGRYLPTPVVDTVRIEDVKPGDDDYAMLLKVISLDDSLMTGVTKAYESTSLDEPQITRQLTKVIVDLSVLLNTSDGFDAEAMGRELFENTTDFGDSDSLYVNIIITKNGTGDELKTNRRALKTILQPTSDKTESYMATALLDTYDSGASITGNSAYDDASHIESMIGSPEPYVISVPLSDFFTSVRMTTSFDKHNNPILRMSQIQVEGYIKDFNDLNDMTIYAVISVGRPKDIAGGLTLSPVAYSLNFSDVTYETVKKEGSLKLFDEAAYMDSEGNYYPQKPLRALNRKYYKIDDFGPVEISNSVKSLLVEYRATAQGDPELQEVIDGITLALVQYESSPDFVLMLEKAADVFPEQAGSSRIGILYERFRRLVVNINTTVMEQEEVVKRIFKNYKIVDARAFTGVPFDSTSYVKNPNPKDFLYNFIFHSNVARYVPIANQQTTYPGDAELPYSPSEREEVYNAKIREMKDRIRALLTNVSWNDFMGRRVDESWYDISSEDFEAINLARAAALDDDLKSISDLPGIYAIDGDPWKGLDNAEAFLIKALEEPIKEAYDWIVNSWSSRFVDPLTSYGPTHSGFHAAFSERDRRSDEGRRYPNPGVWSAGCTNAVVGELMGPAGGGYLIPVNQNRYENTSQRTFSFNALCGTLGVSGWDDLEKIPGAIVREWGVARSLISEYENIVAPSHDILHGAQTSDCIKMSPLIVSKDSTQQSHRIYGAYYNWGRSYGHTATYAGRPLEKTGVSQLQVFVPRTQAIGDALVPRTTEDDWVGTYLEGLTGEEIGMATLEHLKETSVDTIGGIDIFDVHSAVSVSLGGAKTSAPISYLTWTRRPLYDIKASIIKMFSRLLGIDPITGYSSIEEDPDALQFSTPEDYVLEADYVDGGSTGATPSYASEWAGDDLGAGTTAYSSAGSSGTGTSGTSTDPVLLASEVLGKAPSGDRYARVADTNTGTILDEYLKDMPRQMGEYLYDWLFSEIRKMDASELNAESERVAVANSLEVALKTKLDQLLNTYLNNGLCTIIIAAQSEDIGWISYDDNPRKYSAIRRLGSANNGATLFPYGDLSKTVLHVGGGAGRNTSNASDHYKVIQIGNGLKNYLKDYFDDRWPELKSLIAEYLKVQGAHIGFQTDTGIHSALSSTDIVVKKYGYFFFDLEKYIRKNSIVSQFMNVDRFLANVPAAREMTNTVVQINNVSYTNSAFNGLFNMTLNTDTTGGTSNDPTDFESLVINIPIEPGGSLTPQVYNRIEALQDVTFEEIVDTTYIETGGATGMTELESQEVDIDYLADNSEWEYAHLALRNYSFPGFYDSTVGRSFQTWREDYRLACYRYQYFVDDDNAYLGNSHPMAWAAFPTERDAVDIVNLTTWVNDTSHELIIAMLSHYSEIYYDFKNEYIDFAKDNCTFNDFNLRFNDFFIESMISKHGTGRSAPWFRMAAAFVQYQNIFTDIFEGDTVRMMEQANNILEQIRPETGTLYRLLEFDEKCEAMVTEFKKVANMADAAASGSSTNAFTVNVYVGEPVVDHIGDYTDQSDTLIYDVEET